MKYTAIFMRLLKEKKSTWKIELREKTNPEWKDLYSNFTN